MNCNEVRDTLHERFDEGRPIVPGLELHLRQCPACASLATRFSALDDRLMRVPLEPVSRNLVPRIQERLAAERGKSLLPTGLLRAVALGVLLTAGIAGWLYPDLANLTSLREIAPYVSLESITSGTFSLQDMTSATLPSLEINTWSNPFASMLSELSAWWRGLSDRLQPGAWMSPVLLWVSLAVIAVTLLVVNGVGAYSWRAAGMEDFFDETPRRGGKRK